MPGGVIVKKNPDGSTTYTDTVTGLSRTVTAGGRISEGSGGYTLPSGGTISSPAALAPYVATQNTYYGVPSSTPTPEERMRGHIAWFGSPEAYAQAIRQKESQGTSLSDPEAAAAFRKARPDLFPSASSTSSPPSSFSYSSPYSSQINSLIESLLSQLNRPLPTIEEIRQMPEYRSFTRELYNRANEARSNIRALFGAGNIDVSSPYTTAAIERLGEIEKDLAAGLAGIDAELLKVEDARRKDVLSNMLQLLGQLGGLEQQAFSKAYEPWSALLPYQYPTATALLPYRGMTAQEAASGYTDLMRALATLLAALRR